MKKRVELSLVFLFLLIAGLSGCSSSSGTSGTTDYTEEDFHKGTQGLVMNFMKNAPPTKVYEGDKLEVIVELRNKGAYPDSSIFEGKLAVSGFDQNAIRGSWQGGDRIPSSLQGRSIYNPEGGFETMTYRDSGGVRVPFEADRYKPTILVTSCYKYKTIATPIVCIDPDPFAVVQEEKVCDIDQSISVGSGQGGPVSVSAVSEEVGSDTIYFKINVRNSGGGRVYSKNAYTSCPFNIEFDDIDKVMVDAKLPYDSNPSCTPAGTASDPVRIVNGQGYIFCSFKKPSTGSAFTTPLEITLDYVYSDTIEQDVEIIRMK